MKAEDVMKMEAGYPMDAAVRRAFPEVRGSICGSNGQGMEIPGPAPYSTSLDAAAVVERVARTNYGNKVFNLALMKVLGIDPAWCAGGNELDHDEVAAISTASPLDRCKAALLCSLEGGS